MSLAVPKEIRDATRAGRTDPLIPGVDFARELREGETVDFICPEAFPKFSYDNDTYTENDDKYTVACTSLKDYKVKGIG